MVEEMYAIPSHAEMEAQGSITSAVEKMRRRTQMNIFLQIGRVVVRYTYTSQNTTLGFVTKEVVNH